MKLFRLLVFAVAAITITFAQETSTPAPNPQATLTYIHAAWDTLTRSMTDCHSLVDIKVTTNPILYMPADVLPPPAVTDLEQKCHVKIARLPRAIEKLGDVRPEELPNAGLLYLPSPYVVPGGRFNEMYGWDSYFTCSDWKPITAKRWPKAWWIIFSSRLNTTAEFSTPIALTTSPARSLRSSLP